MRTNRVIESVELFGRRQFAVQQQVGNLDETGVLGELLDRVAPVHENALLSVDKSDIGLAAARSDEARVVGEHSLFLV